MKSYSLRLIKYILVKKGSIWSLLTKLFSSVLSHTSEFGGILQYHWKLYAAMTHHDILLILTDTQLPTLICTHQFL